MDCILITGGKRCPYSSRPGRHHRTKWSEARLTSHMPNEGGGNSGGWNFPFPFLAKCLTQIYILRKQHGNSQKARHFTIQVSWACRKCILKDKGKKVLDSGSWETGNPHTAHTNHEHNLDLQKLTIKGAEPLGKSRQGLLCSFLFTVKFLGCGINTVTTWKDVFAEILYAEAPGGKVLTFLQKKKCVGITHTCTCVINQTVNCF